jgi:hypothetical protein
MTSVAKLKIPIPLKVRFLNEYIDDFLRPYVDMPKQRTPEWFAMRKNAIGGSELASILGCDHFCDCLTRMKQKLNIPLPAGDMSPCHWGTMFEGVVMKILEVYLDTIIKGDDICIPGSQGLMFSPDGICVVRMDGDKIDTNDDYENTTPQIVMIEIKSPYRRQPKNIIPENYIPQVSIGLCMTPVANFGLFVDAAFKLCLIDQLGNNASYGTNYHTDRNSWGTPFAWGFNIVISNEDDIIEKYTNGDDIDLLSRPVFINDLLKDISHNELAKIDIGYITFTCGKEYSNVGYKRQGKRNCSNFDPDDDFFDVHINKTLSENPGYKCLGVMPWKLFRLQLIQKERDIKYLENHKNTVTDFVDTMKFLRENKASMGEIKKVFEF